MPEELAQLLPDFSAWAMFFICAMLIGMSKTGVQNIGTFTVPLFALLFGAKHSTGVVLPLLCMADAMAVAYYRKTFHKELVLKPMPWALAGLLVALAVGHVIPETGFKILMGASILLSVGAMLWMERSGKINVIVASSWFAPVMGFIVVFSTMIGNAAGPALAVYLLAMRLPKYAFVATGAWFIMILNFLKIPLQVFIWGNLSWSSFLLYIASLRFLFI